MIGLVDTNVLLDVIQERKPHDAPAARLWKLVEEGTLIGLVSAISFNNIFYVARKQIGNEGALDAVKLVRRVFRFVSFDKTVLDRALAMPAADFEDAIQAAAAIRAGAAYIVTRNADDFTSTGVQTVTADELLALLQP